ncbi:MULTISPECIES: YolD-like family protein [unclassified Virgibacillus]|uniref:YolD-like family protein n=1 Tax=unclassified Virgibacillus TaxID=2620237 RepID=UPI0024DE3A89|nr:YolD-like family protein [Virgibacillus sp. LDC-1]
MPKDRGNIKWISLMLPEHVVLLKEMWNEDNKRKPPVLDIQEAELINRELVAAIKNNCPVTVSFYDNGIVNVHEGLVQWDGYSSYIHLQINNGHAKKIAFQQITSVN